MKSLLRSPFLIASLATNVVLAVLLVHLTDSPSEPAASPNHKDVSRPAAESQPATAPAAIATSSPEALSSSLPVPASPPVSQPALAPTSVPPPAFASRPVTSLPLSIPSQETQNPVSAETVPAASYQTSLSAAAEDPSLGPSRPVNPSAPGNFFISRGVRVAVAESYPAATGGGGMPIGIDLSPADTSSSEDTGATVSLPQTASPASNGDNTDSQRETLSAASSPTPSLVNAPASPKSPKIDPSISPDDIFIMRWGTAAYAEAQTAAKLEADNKGY